MNLLFSYVFISFEGVYLPVPGWIVCSKQLFDQEEVDVVHPLDKEKGITLEDFKLIKMHMVIRTPFCLSFLILFNIIMFTIEFVSYSVRFHLGNFDFSWLMRLWPKFCDMGFCCLYMFGLNNPILTTTFIGIRIYMCPHQLIVFFCSFLSCVLFTMSFANLRLSIFYSPQLYANWLNLLKWGKGLDFFFKSFIYCSSCLV